MTMSRPKPEIQWQELADEGKVLLWGYTYRYYKTKWKGKGKRKKKIKVEVVKHYPARIVSSHELRSGDARFKQEAPATRTKLKNLWKTIGDKDV